MIPASAPGRYRARTVTATAYSDVASCGLVPDPDGHATRRPPGPRSPGTGRMATQNPDKRGHDHRGNLPGGAGHQRDVAKHIGVQPRQGSPETIEKILGLTDARRRSDWQSSGSSSRTPSATIFPSRGYEHVHATVLEARDVVGIGVRVDDDRVEVGDSMMSVQRALAELRVVDV